MMKTKLPLAFGSLVGLAGLIVFAGSGCSGTAPDRRPDAAGAADAPTPLAGMSGGGGAGAGGSGGKSGSGGGIGSGGMGAGGLASGGIPAGGIDGGAGIPGNGGMGTGGLASGGISAGGIDGGTGGGGASSDGATGSDASTTADMAAGDAFWSTVVRLCTGKALPTARNLCRTVADCGPTGPVACSVGYYDWGPSGCPLPPSSQPCPMECAADADCTARAGGTCVPYTRTCPRCDGHVCQYPPPPCTTSPDSCGTGQRCGADGTCEVIPCTDGNACGPSYRCNATSPAANQQGCEPIPCDEGSTCTADRRCNPSASAVDAFGCELTPCDAGYACPADNRCNLGSSRADGHGCEYVPCGDGYACPENTRCTVADPAARDHGCTIMPCKSDGDCDCGYCVNDVCSADPGTCQYPPA
jgi:hypothetical protein